MSRNLVVLSISIFVAFSISFSKAFADTLYAGLRCSKYGFKPMPSTTELGKMCKLMALRFEASGRTSIPCAIWVVSYFDDTTTNNYLAYFDNNGIKALLQVEPNDTPVGTLITDVLTKFKSHTSVIGFGVDVEWYCPQVNAGMGKKVSDEDARAWRTNITSFKPDYVLLLTHSFVSWMPPTERTGIVFLHNQTGYPSLNQFLHSTSKTPGYIFWVNNLYPGIIGKLYGFDDVTQTRQSDKVWWSKLKDPQKEIGDSCIAVGPNTKYLFWVDFTAYDVTWDLVSDTKQEPASKDMRILLTVQNRTITIKNRFLEKGKPATVSLFTLNGTLVMSMTYEDISKGIVLKAANTLSQGIYVVQVESDKRLFSGKISL